MGVGEVKRKTGWKNACSPILGRDARLFAPPCDSGWETMAETRIKPYPEQQAEEARRAEQQRQFRRNQVYGLVLLAAAICAWWLFHTNPKWIFPPGWWRW